MWLSGKVVKKCFDASKKHISKPASFMTSSLVNTCTINAFEEVLKSTLFIVTARLEVNVYDCNRNVHVARDVTLFMTFRS
jgi:hypothetical protein